MKCPIRSLSLCIYNNNTCRLQAASFPSQEQGVVAGCGMGRACNHIKALIPAPFPHQRKKHSEGHTGPISYTNAWNPFPAYQCLILILHTEVRNIIISLGMRLYIHCMCAAGGMYSEVEICFHLDQIFYMCIYLIVWC